MLTHDTRDSLVINHQATSPELVRDPSVSVGGELGQDVFDPNAQIRIGLLPGCPVGRYSLRPTMVDMLTHDTREQRSLQ